MLHKKIKHVLLLSLVSISCLVTGCADNTSSKTETFHDASAYEGATATVLSGESLGAMNTYDKPENMIPISKEIDFAQNFVYEAPKYSLTVIRIEKK